MSWMRPLLATAALCVLGAAAFSAQAPAKNPLEGNAAAIQAGMGLFRGRCGDCHGIDATGVRGPDITQIWANGRSDDGIFKTIKGGVPGTEMPANPRLNDTEIWQIMAHLRTLAAPTAAAAPKGVAENGEKIFRAMCASCHRVNGVGIEGFASGFEPVTLTPVGGKPVVGVKKNEDLFSVQIMDVGERIQGFEKSALANVQDGTRSAMPAFPHSRLSDPELDDLLRYLQSLRGFDPAVRQ
jgi:mono/diheme cytochrome c family protein